MPIDLGPAARPKGPGAQVRMVQLPSRPTAGIMVGVGRAEISGQGQAMLPVDWETATEALLVHGWVRLQEVVPSEATMMLTRVEGRQWRPLHDEGVVHQAGFGSFMPLASAPEPVAVVGTEIVAAVSDAAHQHRLDSPPPFNEVTWTRYPRGSGQITTHRDPDTYTGLIAVLTLDGSARFRVRDEESSRWVTWLTLPGDVVLLRSGWPTAAHLCPPHAAEAPSEGERMIMTFRSNSNGAGGGYSVG